MQLQSLVGLVACMNFISFSAGLYVHLGFHQRSNKCHLESVMPKNVGSGQCMNHAVMKLCKLQGAEC